MIEMGYQNRMVGCSEVYDRAGTVSQTLPSVFVYVVKTVAAERPCADIRVVKLYVDRILERICRQL